MAASDMSDNDVEVCHINGFDERVLHNNEHRHIHELSLAGLAQAETLGEEEDLGPEETPGPPPHPPRRHGGGPPAAGSGPSMEASSPVPAHACSYVDVADCPVSRVVVYRRRADVSRLIRMDMPAGDTEIVVQRLSPHIDGDTIRVDYHGTGFISDVMFRIDRTAEVEEAYNSEATKLTDLIQKEKQALRRLSATRLRSEKQTAVLESFADSMLAPNSNQQDCLVDGTNSSRGTSSMAMSAQLASLQSFLEIYDVKADNLDKDIAQIDMQISVSECRIKEWEETLADLNVKHADNLARDVSIIVTNREATRVDLILSYVIGNAEWYPQYDIQACRIDGIVRINYYAVIKQNTQEDWTDAKIFLSTSQPGTGGVAPELSPTTLGFRQGKRQGYDGGSVNELQSRGRQSLPESQSGLKRSVSVRNRRSGGTVLPLVRPTPDATGRGSIGTAPRSGSLSTTAADDEESAKRGASFRPSLSTQYEIMQYCTVIANNEPHRVSIGKVDLTATYSYHCVPRRTPHAYLRVEARNSSSLALLAGQANIYIRDCFVGKSNLQCICPDEVFACNLGVDTGVAINYPPMWKQNVTFGSACKTSSINYQQIIEVRNTYGKMIKVLVEDQLPVSCEEKIKVNLQEPNIKHPEKYDKSKPIRLTKHGIVEWEQDILPAEAKTLVLRYTVEYPSSEELEITLA